jgi:Neuraminidase (sialidase)
MTRPSRKTTVSSSRVWQDMTLAPSGSAIAFPQSLDGGVNWSQPVRINTRPDMQAFTPSIAVLPDGTIGVTHDDLRFNTADRATLPTDYWFLHSHDGGNSWSEARVTGTPSITSWRPTPRGCSSATTPA